MSDHVRQLTRERDRLRLLLDVNNAVVSHLDLRDLLRAVSACLGKLVPHELSTLALYDPKTNQFRVGALNFPEHSDFLQQSQLVPIEGTPAGLAFTTRKPTLRTRLDLEDAEREHILRALRDTKWVIGGSHGAAAKLGLRRSTLQSKMRRLGIVRPI
ncbi:MAG TPA: helix-turn-helix domain-containing protein [Blastocatellia bacterium]|nr:helix-turn-helix domain-containing protein [Blastocatellia bacterium]